MDMEITFPVYRNEDKDQDYHTIDGLAFLTDDVIGEWRSDAAVGVSITCGLMWSLLSVSSL